MLLLYSQPARRVKRKNQENARRPSHHICLWPNHFHGSHKVPWSRHHFGAPICGAQAIPPGSVAASAREACQSRCPVAGRLAPPEVADVGGPQAPQTVQKVELSGRCSYCPILSRNPPRRGIDPLSPIATPSSWPGSGREISTMGIARRKPPWLANWRSPVPGSLRYCGSCGSIGKFSRPLPASEIPCRRPS